MKMAKLKVIISFIGVIILLSFYAEAATLDSDNFDDNSFNTTKWTSTVSGAGSVTEQNQRLETVCPGNGDECYVNYDNTFPASNYSISINLTDVNGDGNQIILGNATLTSSASSYVSPLQKVNIFMRKNIGINVYIQNATDCYKISPTNNSYISMGCLFAGSTLGTDLQGPQFLVNITKNDTMMQIHFRNGSNGWASTPIYIFNISISLINQGTLSDYFAFGDPYTGNFGPSGYWDDWVLVNTTAAADTSPPLITQVNFTSEDGQVCGGATACGPTNDTTPTFKITTDENAYCRIDDANNNYTTMSGTRNCTSGMGSTSLTCTLGTDDALVLGGTDYVYIACQDLSGNENSTTITMNLTGGDLQTNATSAILEGITDAVLSSPITYTSQQVYVRYADGTQNLTRFDVVASSGSKRWFFNYILDSDVFTYFRQILPSIYVWENSTLIYNQVRSQVGAFVNATK